jgi:hypothetical protein
MIQGKSLGAESIRPVDMSLLEILKGSEHDPKSASKKSAAPFLTKSAMGTLSKLLLAVK